MKSDKSRKDRPVVNIRGLNALTRIDVYSLSLQKDLISVVKGYIYLTVMNYVSFFYQ